MIALWIIIGVCLFAAFWVLFNRPSEASNGTQHREPEPNRANPPKGTNVSAVDAQRPAKELVEFLLQAKERLLANGISRDQLASLDATTDRVFDSVNALVQGYPATETTISAIRDMVRPVVEPHRYTPEKMAQVGIAVEELLQVGTTFSYGSPEPGFVGGLRNWATRLNSMPPMVPFPGNLEQALKSLNIGDYLSVQGRLCEVTGIHTNRESYDGETWTWFDASLAEVGSGKKVSIEWEFDDEVEIGLVEEEGGPGLFELTRNQMSSMIEEEEGFIRFRGHAYELSDAGEAKFFRDQNASGERYYYADFEGKDDVYLSIEDWDGDVRCFVMRSLLPSDVKAFGRV